MLLLSELDLHVAVSRLERAIDQLISPRFMRIDIDDHDAYTAFKPSLYAEMVNTPTRQPEQSMGRGVAKSMPPLRLESLDWLLEVDRTVNRWLPGSSNPLKELRRLGTVQSWRPQDTDEIVSRAKTVEGWVASAEQYLDNRSSFDIRGKCPECQATHVYRTDDNGDKVRSAALQANSLAAECQKCHHQWVGPESVQELADKISVTD